LVRTESSSSDSCALTKTTLAFDANLPVAESKAKVVLLKAYESNDEDSILTNNQEFSSVDDTTYQFNFLNLKPEIGSYTLDFRVTPTDKKYSAIDNVSFNVRVVGTISISDTQITIVDSIDVYETNEGKKYKIDSGKKLKEVVHLNGAQHIFVDFKVKDSSGKSVEVQQAFIRIGHNDAEYIQITEYSDKGYNVHINGMDLGNEFYSQSGNYEAELIIGDTFVQNPIAWTFATFNINFTKEGEVPRSPFDILPEIHHLFRQADKRPEKQTSMAFTGAILGIPSLILLFGLFKVGANLSNFPSGSNFIWAIGFQASLGAILVLFGLYWLRLNMMQTLGYLTILTIPLLFFSHKNLNALSNVNQHTE